MTKKARDGWRGWRGVREGRGHVTTKSGVEIDKTERQEMERADEE